MLSDPTGLTPDKKPESKQLCELYLCDAQFSSEDLQTVLINCSNIEVLRHPQLVKALYNLHSIQWKFKPKKAPCYKLRNLDIDFASCVSDVGDNFAIEALELAIAVCPSARWFTAVQARYSPVDALMPLLKMQKLEELNLFPDTFNIQYFHSRHQSLCVPNFSRFIVPVLEKHGQSLRVLHLCLVGSVRIELIASLCPNLETLVLQFCFCAKDDFEVDVKTRSTNKQLHPFQNLKKLYIFEFTPNISSQQMEYLISSPCLQHVVIDSIYFTAREVGEVVQKRSLPHLTGLYFVKCVVLTADHIISFLSNSNPPKYLIVQYCDRIDKEASEKVMNYIKEKCLSVFVYIL